MNSAAAPRARSLTVRLGWRLAVVIVTAVMLGAAAVAWRAIATVDDIDDSALQAQIRVVAPSLPDSPGPTAPLVLPAALVAQFRASDGDNLLLVYRGAQLAATSDDAAAAQLAPLLPHTLRRGLFRVPAFFRHPKGMVGLVADAGPWRIVVLQGREQSAALIDSLLEDFLADAIWLLLPIGVASVLVGVLTVRLELLPLRQVSEAAALVGPSRPGARLPVAALPTEIVPIVHAMNDALSRLERALMAQHLFVAEAAHSLRTPLAVLAARLDMLEGQPGIAALRHDSDWMARLVGQLLRMARLEGLPLDVTQVVDLHAVATEAIADLAPLAVRGGKALALAEAPCVRPVRGNHAALVLAVTNLLENALAHAPAHSLVEITLATPATIAVHDRGPGVPPAYRDSIFRRFERGPAQAEDGAGLGLAIVAEIAAAHGGSVRVVERPGGGSTFVVDLQPVAAE